MKGNFLPWSAAVILAAWSASAAGPAAPEDWPRRYDPLGSLILTQFVSAPFPHPARANGHRYHDQFYSAAEHYSSSEVALFVPKSFHESGRVVLVVHFHGWLNTVATTFSRYDLPHQLCESGRNAILVVPEGPQNAPDSFGGKLEDPGGFKRFVDETMDCLRSAGVLSRTNLAAPEVILSGHSGGYHVIAGILDRGGLNASVKEVWLFDALYGNTPSFANWEQATHGRLVDIYTDHGGTREESEKFLAASRTGGLACVSLEESNRPAATWPGDGMVFVHSDLPHDEVVFRRHEFTGLLTTSRLSAP